MITFNYYNHLGFHNPYYTKINDKILIYSENSLALEGVKHRTLDFSAVVQILSTGYAFGDRTLIQEIKKTPWMAQPNEDSTDWTFFDVPKHNEKTISEEESSTEFYKLLEQELFNYVENHFHIGILLTGGMDSRIVAAVLNNLILSGKLKNRKVTAYTWGSRDSRDVVYAERIANLFGWEWKHLQVDVEQMLQNFNLTIQNGCEYTPIHLHAMSKVAEEIDLDCILAGSFGDSIGRGEYSGTKVKNLESLESKIKNLAGLLRSDYQDLIKDDLKKDVAFYHKQFPEKFQYQQNEQDLQVHYMRRMLNPCMNIINKKIPLYQMFSAPFVFGYIWSIEPDFRTDLIYKRILEKYSPNLLEIPWARTGLLYPEKEGTPDSYKKSHHKYGEMIRNNYLNLIEEKVNNNKVILSQIFNFNSVKRMISNCRNYPIKSSFIYEEKLFWIAALIEFINKNNVEIDLPRKKVLIEFFPALLEEIKYKSKYIYKKIR